MPVAHSILTATSIGTISQTVEKTLPPVTKTETKVVKEVKTLPPVTETKKVFVTKGECRLACDYVRIVQRSEEVRC